MKMDENDFAGPLSTTRPGPSRVVRIVELVPRLNSQDGCLWALKYDP